jgi:hypothetical protein
MIVAADGIRRALHAAADRPLLVDTRGDQRTGHSLAERIGRVAGELARRGLRGRRIGVWYENSLAAFEAFLAVEWLGGTRIPVDPGVPASEARAVFEAAEVDAVLADCGRAGLLGGDVLVHDDESPLSGPLWSEEVRVPPETALVVYPRAVSGGQLFGVATSYRNWTAIMDINRSLFHTGRYGTPFGDDECFLTVQQLMHGTGMVGSFPFLLMGLPQVVLPRFDSTPRRFGGYCGCWAPRWSSSTAGSRRVGRWRYSTTTITRRSWRATTRSDPAAAGRCQRSNCDSARCLEARMAGVSCGPATGWWHRTTATRTAGARSAMSPALTIGATCVSPDGSTA